MEARLVVITGASSGIGAAVADCFASDGHPVLLLSRHIEPVEALHGTPVMSEQVDVTDHRALQAAIAAAEARFAATSCLVNSAGLLRIGAFESRDPAELSEEIDVLLKGVVNAIKAVLPGMIERRSGTVINVSSIADRKPGPTGEVYHACKAAIRSLGESLQQAEASRNIRFINVAPGFVKTNIHAQMGISFEEYRARLGNPDFIEASELADIIHFCWKQPQRICVRDIVVMPTNSGF